jgi:hypothetical protein
LLLTQSSYFATTSAREARTQDEELCLMARTLGTLSRRRHADAKAGKNIGEVTREDANQRATQTNQRSFRDTINRPPEPLLVEKFHLE